VTATAGRAALDVARAAAGAAPLRRRGAHGRDGPTEPSPGNTITHHGVVLYEPESILERELDAVRRRMAELSSRRIELPDGSWYWDLKPDWRPGEVVDL